MKLRISLPSQRRRHAVIPLSLLILVPLVPVVLFGQSCLRRNDGLESQILASGVGQVETVTRTFRRVIGRDPGQAEIAALRPLNYPDMVTALLGSQQYDQEGFFNLQRERLLLNREGSQAWVRQSYNDYCALRLEMSEQASEDRAGQSGYFNMLRYRERWVQFGGRQSACFLGTDVANLLKVKSLGDSDTTDNTDTSPKFQQALQCARNLRWNFPYSNPNGTEEEQQAEVKQFWDAMTAIPEAERSKNLLDFPFGEKFFMTGLKGSIAPDFAEAPAGAKPYKDYDISIVKKDGQALVLREMGTQADQQCLFAPFNLSEWEREDAGSGGDEDEEDFNLTDRPRPTDTGPGSTETPSTETPSTVAPPSDSVVVATPTEPVVPIDFPNPVGLPDQPTIMPAEELMQNEAVQATMAKANGPIFIKIKVPEELEGVHASPYWLSRHPSKTKNRNLHRARLVYFSYFCADINPDAANFSGAPVPDFPPLLKPYFDENDNHVKGSMNCYNCHTKIQPIANFFGQQSFGTQYDNSGDSDEFGSGASAFLNVDDPFYRPGGIFDGDKFFPVQGSTFGMEGLANVLSAYPAARSCIVDSTWASLVGRDHPLTEKERAAALLAFNGGENGTPRLSELVKHLTVANKRGETFFTKGEQAMTQIVEEPEFVCPTELPPDMGGGALGTLQGPCADCHVGQFIDDNQKFNVDYYFSEGNEEDTPESRGNLWQRLTCKVKTNTMPPEGSGVSLDKAKRNHLWCFLSRQRDAMAVAGKIPMNFKDKSCAGESPSAITQNPHEIGGAPGGGQ